MKKLIQLVLAAAIMAPSALSQYYSASIHFPNPGDGASLRRGAGEVYGGYTINPVTQVWGAAILGQSGWINLNPPGQTFSRVHDVFRTYQVGYCGNTGTHGASLWRGSAATFVNLHPQGNYSSNAYAMEGNRVVGYVTPTSFGNYRATVWTSSSAASAVDVHPLNWTRSILHDTNGTQHCGVLREPTFWHAGLWEGTSRTVRDLHPAWADNSLAWAMHGPYQVGFASIFGRDHATRWQGTRNSAIDIHPAFAHSSNALGIFDGIVVGWYSLSTQNDRYAAILDSYFGFIDLHQFLPANYDWSVANGIAENGYILGEARDTLTGQLHGVIWKP